MGIDTMKASETKRQSDAKVVQRVFAMSKKDSAFSNSKAQPYIAEVVSSSPSMNHDISPSAVPQLHGNTRVLPLRVVAMCKVLVAFLAAMEIMAEQFPGAFSGYSLQVLESHQASKVDASGTAKAVVSCFHKLGVSFDMDEIQLVRESQQQLEMVGVPEEHLAGHAFHMYHLTSPDQTVSFEFQHNVCGRSIYAEGTVDAVIFLAKKIEAKDPKRVYNMIDVLREGNMR